MIFAASNDENVATTEASTDAAAAATAAGSDAQHPQQWSDEEIESLLLTIILFGVLTSLIYNFVIKPVLQPAANNNGRQQQGGRGVNDDAVAFQRQRFHQQQQQRRVDQFNMEGNDSDDIQPDGDLYALLKSLARVPPHIATSSSSTSSKITSLILQEGVVPFRYTHASSFEKNTLSSSSTSNSNGDDLVMKNRRERAKIFAKLFRPPSSSSSADTSSASTTIPPPPVRGANVIITIKASDITSPKIHSILYLLGTYYNLFVILSLQPPSFHSTKSDNNNNNDLDEEKRELEVIESYKSKLKVPKEVIPSHRIIASTSSLGRVAFVRQLGKKGAEVILDYDVEVKEQLNRFGFCVLLYPEVGGGGNGGEESFSGLGDMLLP